MTLSEDHQESKRHRQRQRKHRRVIIFSHLLTLARLEIMSAMDIDHIRINLNIKSDYCLTIFGLTNYTEM